MTALRLARRYADRSPRTPGRPGSATARRGRLTRPRSPVAACAARMPRAARRSRAARSGGRRIRAVPLTGSRRHAAARQTASTRARPWPRLPAACRARVRAAPSAIPPNSIRLIAAARSRRPLDPPRPRGPCRRPRLAGAPVLRAVLVVERTCRPLESRSRAAGTLMTSLCRHGPQPALLIAERKLQQHRFGSRTSRWILLRGQRLGLRQRGVARTRGPDPRPHLPILAVGLSSALRAATSVLRSTVAPGCATRAPRRYRSSAAATALRLRSAGSTPSRMSARASTSDSSKTRARSPFGRLKRRAGRARRPATARATASTRRHTTRMCLAPGRCTKRAGSASTILARNRSVIAERGLEGRARLPAGSPPSRSTTAMFSSVSASPWSSRRLSPDRERLTQVR